MDFKVIAAFASLVSMPALAVPVTLTFEGATSFASVNSFYGGGTDSAGVSGANYGVSFGGDALALSNDVLGPNFSNAPTPGTVLAPVGTDATLNSLTGFSGLTSFYYSTSANRTVNVYSGLGGTGALLGSFSLLANAQSGCSDSPYCHWDLTNLNIAGIARSITFGSAANTAGFDNITLNTVPEPAAFGLLLAGLVALRVRSRGRTTALAT